MKRPAVLDDQRLSDGIFPFCFVVSAVFNFGIFYLGLAFEENPFRVYLYGLLDVVLVLLCAWMLLRALLKTGLPAKCYILLGIVVLFYGGVYLSGFVRYGFDSTLLHYASRFAALSVPAFLAGVYAAMNRTEKRFFEMLESISFFILPAGLMFCGSVTFGCNPFGDGSWLGVYNYMALAYYFLPFLAAHMICFSENRPLVIPAVKGQARHPQLLRGALIVMYWYGIIATGTRGAMVCGVVFSVLLVLFRLFQRRLDKRTILAVVMVIVVAFFLIVVYAPPMVRARFGRWAMFFSGLQEGELVTSTTGVSRGVLYENALKEFLHSPITGMGPFGYSEKYGLYPHNGVLELLCELGLAGSIPVFALLVFAVVRLLRAGKGEPFAIDFILFLSTFAVRANMSDTIWDCPPLLGILGFALVWRMGNSTKKAEKALNERTET